MSVLNLDPSYVLKSHEEAAEVVEDSMAEKLNEISGECTDNEYDEIIEKATYVDAPDGSWFVRIDDKIYAADKSSLQQTEDGIYQWTVPDKVQLTNSLGYNAKSYENTVVSAGDVVKKYNKWSEFNRVAPPDEIREKVVMSMSGREVNDVPYIVYPSEMFCVQGYNKFIALPIEQNGERMDMNFLEIRDSNPYDFKIGESEIKDGGDPNKFYNVLSLPPFKAGKQAGKVCTLGENSDPREFRMVCLSNNKASGKNTISIFDLDFASFRNLSEYAMKTSLENTLGRELNGEERLAISSKDLSDPVKKAVYDQYLAHLDESLECVTVRMPDELHENGKFDYYIPSGRGDYAVSTKDTSIAEFGSIRVQPLKFDNIGARRGNYPNPGELEIKEQIYFGGNGSEMCFPANVKLGANGYTVKDLRDDTVHFDKFARPSLKDGMKEVVAAVDRTRITAIDNASASGKQIREFEYAPAVSKEATLDSPNV